MLRLSASLLIRFYVTGGFDYCNSGDCAEIYRFAVGWPLCMQDNLRSFSAKE